MIYITSILLAAASVQDSDPMDAQLKISSEAPASKFSLGKDRIQQVRSAYENGKYNQFLTEMDLAYAKADLKELMSLRADQLPSNFNEELEQKLSAIQKKKGEELLQQVTEDDQSLFSQRVRSLASSPVTETEEKALSKLHSIIALKPNKGKNVDENTLIDIDLEYEYKIELAHTEDSERSLNRQMALRMEKLDKMAQAAKHFEDKELKNAVEIAKKSLDARLARNLDGAELTKTFRKTEVDEQQARVHLIIKDYQAQFSDLIKEIGQ